MFYEEDEAEAGAKLCKLSDGLCVCAKGYTFFREALLIIVDVFTQKILTAASNIDGSAKVMRA